jgi:transcription initiation factor TFIIH subunit 4
VDITSFLDGLTPAQRDALYASPWTCQAVFRSLPALAKAYVLDLLLIDQPVPQGEAAQFGTCRKC